VVADRAAALGGEHPAQWAGPLFWGAQRWILIADVLGLALCGWAAWHGRTRSERFRPLLVLGAILLPVVAHFAYVGDWLPIDYTLSPGAAGLAVLLFALAIPGHGLLESQPIVRQDLIEHMPDGLVLADAAGIVLDANAAAESILGRSRDALRGGRLEAILEALGAGSDGEQLAGRIAGLPLVGARLEGELRTADARTIEVTAGALGSVGAQPAGASSRSRTAHSSGATSACCASGRSSRASASWPPGSRTRSTTRWRSCAPTSSTCARSRSASTSSWSSTRPVRTPTCSSWRTSSRRASRGSSASHVS
jgi:PAS domain-containing protein